MNISLQDVGLAVSAAGTTQATATLLINGISQITTAAANSGVILQVPPSGGVGQLVFNGGANGVKVYPPIGSTINSLTANLPLILAPNTACQFWSITATSFVGILSA